MSGQHNQSIFIPFDWLKKDTPPFHLLFFFTKKEKKDEELACRAHWALGLVSWFVLLFSIACFSSFHFISWEKRQPIQERENKLNSCFCLLALSFASLRRSSLLWAGCRGAAAPLTHPKRTQLPEENKASRELRRNSSSSIIHFIHNWFHWTVPLGGTKDKSIQFNQLHPFSKNGVELNLNLICCAA